MHDPLATAQSERQHLRRQVMIGYVLYQPDLPWDGILYHRLERARAAMGGHDATAEVVLVHETGTLYYQSSGDALGRVLKAGGLTVHLPVRRHQKALRDHLRRESERRLAARQVPAPRATAGGRRGFSHLAYLD